jgi:hypothetical protein
MGTAGRAACHIARRTGRGRCHDSRRSQQSNDQSEHPNDAHDVFSWLGRAADFRAWRVCHRRAWSHLAYGWVHLRHQPRSVRDGSHTRPLPEHDTVSHPTPASSRRPSGATTATRRACPRSSPKAWYKRAIFVTAASRRPSARSECEHDGNGEDKHDGKKLLERLGAMETWS